MTNNYVGKTVKLSILCVIMAATIAFSIWHSCGYCASADDVAQIFRQNEQLFERCQSALEREPAISHIVFREGECISNVSYYCIDGIYYAGQFLVKSWQISFQNWKMQFPFAAFRFGTAGRKSIFSCKCLTF